MKKTTRICCVFAFISLAVWKLPFPALAQTGAGDLDASFGSGGKIMSNLSFSEDFANAAAVQPDGKILAAGRSQGGALIRYHGDGTVDTDFGELGVAHPFLPVSQKIHALVIQPDAKIVTVGYWTNLTPDGGFDNAVICRTNPDGTPDTTFGVSWGCRLFQWEVEPNVYYHSYLYGVALQSDGKIVAVGDVWKHSPDLSKNYFGMVRFNADGTFDNSFSNDGRLVTGFGPFTQTSGSSFARAVDVHPGSGKIVVAGYTVSISDGEDFAVKMVNPDGTLDPGFGTTFFYTGRRTDFLGGNDRAYAVAFQDSRVLVAGSATIQNGDEDFAFARYNSNGTLDSSFGFGGMSVTTFGGYSDIIFGIKLQPDGKIIAAGQRSYFHLKQVARDFALARYSPNGFLDPTFSGDGKLTTDFGTTNDVAKAVALQADGKIVAAGFVGAGTYREKFALARYLP